MSFFCCIRFFVSRCKHNILISVTRINPLSPWILYMYDSYMYTLYPEYWHLPTACASAASVKRNISKTNKPFNSDISISIIHDFIIIVDDCIHQYSSVLGFIPSPIALLFYPGVMPAWLSFGRHMFIFCCSSPLPLLGMRWMKTHIYHTSENQAKAKKLGYCSLCKFIHCQHRLLLKAFFLHRGSGFSRFKGAISVRYSAY